MKPLQNSWLRFPNRFKQRQKCSEREGCARLPRSSSRMIITLTFNAPDQRSPRSHQCILRLVPTCSSQSAKKRLGRPFTCYTGHSRRTTSRSWFSLCCKIRRCNLKSSQRCCLFFVTLWTRENSRRKSATSGTIRL